MAGVLVRDRKFGTEGRPRKTEAEIRVVQPQAKESQERQGTVSLGAQREPGNSPPDPWVSDLWSPELREYNLLCPSPAACAAL